MPRSLCDHAQQPARDLVQVTQAYASAIPTQLVFELLVPVETIDILTWRRGAGRT